MYGQTFKVRTDHGSLQWLLRFKNPEGQIARWLETLSSYQFIIEHRPGRLHGNADALSRRPCAEIDCGYYNKAEVRYQPEKPAHSCLAVETRAQTSSKTTPEKDTDSEHFNIDIAKCQLDDPDLSYVIKWVQDGTQPEWKDISSLSETCKFYWVRFESLKYIDNILYCQTQEKIGEKCCIVIPKSLVGKVLALLHNSTTGGHLGIKNPLKSKGEIFLVQDEH